MVAIFLILLVSTVRETHLFVRLIIIIIKPIKVSLQTVKQNLFHLLDFFAIIALLKTFEEVWTFFSKKIAYPTSNLNLIFKRYLCQNLSSPSKQSFQSLIVKRPSKLFNQRKPSMHIISQKPVGVVQKYVTLRDHSNLLPFYI